MHNTEALFASYKIFAERIAVAFGDDRLVSRDENVSVALAALHRAVQCYDCTQGLFEPLARAAIREELNKVAESRKRNDFINSGATQSNAEPQATRGILKLPTSPEYSHVVAIEYQKEPRMPRLSSLSDRAKRFIELFTRGYDLTVIRQMLDAVASERATSPESGGHSSITNDLSKELMPQYLATHTAEVSPQPTTENCQPPILTSKIIPGVIYDELTHYRGENGSPH